MAIHLLCCYCRLLDGFTLAQASFAKIPSTISPVQNEGRVLALAAQLLLVSKIEFAALFPLNFLCTGISQLRVCRCLQAVFLLHDDTRLCHLDIIGNNLVLLTPSCGPWDNLRLLDFGYAQKCSQGIYSPFAY